MRRRAAALLCALVLVCQAVVWPAKAADEICFIAVNSEVLPLSDATMPFWVNGYLYIPASIFTGTVRKELGINYIRTSQNLPILSSSGRALLFDLEKGTVSDDEGISYSPAAIQRGGEVFVPVTLVALFFGISYYQQKVPRGRLVQIYNDKAGLTGKSFADAAIYPMEVRYSEYLRSKETDEQTPETVPDEPQTPEETEETEGKNVYLCMLASDGGTVEVLLDELDRKGDKAAFFCTEEFLTQEGGLLRRMMATGQAVGLAVDASDPERSVTEQLLAANELLYQATCTKSRLAVLENEKSQARQQAEEAGFCCLEADLDRSSYELKSSSGADSLLRRVTARRGSVTVWLGDGVDAVGLRAFLTAAEEADDPCLAITETT